MKLKEIIPLLPKYDCNNAYGKKGEIKGVIFSYKNGGNLSYKELSQELIDNTMVEGISPVGSAYRSHCNLKLWLSCIDIRENNINDYIDEIEKKVEVAINE